MFRLVLPTVLQRWLTRRARLAALVCAFVVAAPAQSWAGSKEARIYVIRESDGTLRFTNRAPAGSQNAEVFTARGSKGRFIKLRGSGTRRGRYHPDLYNEAIFAAADEHRVDPALIKAVIHAESAFNPYAVSPKGAQGLMQLMPSTGRMMGLRTPFSPTSNIRAGTRYLATLLRRFGNESHAIAAYNAGEAPVSRYGGVPPYAETRAYVRRVLALKKQYSAAHNG